MSVSHFTTQHVVIESSPLEAQDVFSTSAEEETEAAGAL